VYDQWNASRRALLLSGAAVAASLAGCSSDNDESPETPEPTPSPTETGTQTETSEDSAPSLEEFEYPAGTSQSGLGPTNLFRTHEATLTDAGSATLTGELTRRSNNFEETLALERRLSEEGLAILREDTGDGLTENLWASGPDAMAYVKLTSGFNERYRIDNDAPTPSRVVQFDRFRRLLIGAEWSEAIEVIPAGADEYAVTYEATGIADEQPLFRLQFGSSIEEFDATIAVSQAGYIRAISYDITTESSDGPRQQVVTTDVEAVGETTVQEPEWAGTAREEGIRFDASATDGGTTLELAMVNGGEVPADARVSLSDPNGRGEATLSNSVTPGDSLFMSLSDSNELLVGTDGASDGGRSLRDFVRATVRYRGFELFVFESEI